MDDDDLLRRIYAAGAEPEEWPALLAHLAARFRSSRAVLYDRSIGEHRRPLGVNAIIGYDAAAIAAVQTYFRHRDVRVHHLARLATGHVYVDDRDIPFADIARSEIQNDFYRPNGVGHASGVVLAHQPDQASILSLHRDAAHAAFTAAEIALLDRLGPHLTQAWKVTRTVLRHANGANALADALDRTGAGVFIVATNARLLRLTAEAETMLTPDSPLRLRDGHLTAHHPANAARLAALLAATTPQQASLAAARPLALLAVPRPQDGAVMLFASDPSRRPIPDSARVAAQFGLTPAEARAALALADGQGAPEIATQFGVAVETVRSQLKSAMAKTETRSQTALAITILRSLAYLRTT